jgi:hypothetical protein
MIVGSVSVLVLEVNRMLQILFCSSRKHDNWVLLLGLVFVLRVLCAPFGVLLRVVLRIERRL